MVLSCVALSLSACSPATLRTMNRAGAALTVVSLAGDWCGTRSAAAERWSDRKEGGVARMAIGSAPTTRAVDGYFAITTLAILGLAQLVPERVRPFAYGLVTGIELATVAGNVAYTDVGCGL